MANRINRLITIPDEFVNKLPSVQRKMFLKIVEKMNAVKVVDGFIVPTSVSDNFVSELSDFLHNELLDSSYTDSVKSFVSEFDKQKDLTQKYYSSEFNTDAVSAIGDRAVKAIKAEVVESLITDSVKTDFLKPLEGLLNNAINSGSGFNETLKNIRDFVEGNEDVDGAILKYSKQLAHDSFANSDRAYNSAVADELDIEWFLWAGGEIATTRCFCLQRHGKYYHYKEIEAWGRQEDLGDCRTDNGWAGMNRGTDEKTIFTYGGGYGCLHTVAGVSLFSVPKEDVQRNIDNGNFEPTEVELRLLGL